MCELEDIDSTIHGLPPESEEMKELLAVFDCIEEEVCEDIFVVLGILNFVLKNLMISKEIMLIFQSLVIVIHLPDSDEYYSVLIQ